MTELPLADRADVVLPMVAADLKDALESALFSDDPEAEREALSALVAADPAFLEAWGRLAEVARDDVECYAYARVGYHRGLDALRAAGWGGTGYCRWEHPSNRGFLRCLASLRSAAAALGETDEVERIGRFLHDLDPDWDDAVVEKS